LLDLLNRSVLFASLTPAERREVAVSMRRKAIGTEEAVTVAGERSEGLFIVGRGRFSVRAGSRELATLGPGDHFGEISWVYETPRTATVRAIDGGVVWVLPADELQALVERNPGFRASVTYEAATRYSAALDPEEP
jgi:cAMP-dependent protein kinase regulator